MYIIIVYAIETTKEKKMQITDIKIRKTYASDSPMKAVVSVTFDDQLALHDIKVINTREKYFIVMPSRKNPDGAYRDIVHPINAPFRAELEDAIIDAYEKAYEVQLDNEKEEESVETTV